MENVTTKIKIIVEGNLSYVSCDNSHVIELTINSITRDLWTEQLTILAETIKSDGKKIDNGEGVVRTHIKGNKMKCKKFRK